MATLLISPELQFIDANGSPIVGTLATYVPGTLDPVTTWQDANETILNEAVIQLDDRGSCIVYADGDVRLILRDTNDVQVFDQLSSAPLPASAISTAMLPVVGAQTLAQAMQLMGVNAFVNAAISAIELEPGPTGPTGPIGPTGATGATGPAGASANFTYSFANPGYILMGNYGSAPLLQFGSAASNSGGAGSVSFARPFVSGCSSVLMSAINNYGWWANVGSVSNSGFQFSTSSPLVGGGWVGGPVGVYWFAIGV